MTLSLVRGIPGSGKSTWTKRNFSCLHLENDMFHMKDGRYIFSERSQKDAIDWCMETARDALSRGMDVVVSNTFTKRRYVEAYRRIAEETGANFEVYRCTGNFKNVHGVPEKIFENMKNNFEDYPGEKLL